MVAASLVFLGDKQPQCRNMWTLPAISPPLRPMQGLVMLAGIAIELGNAQIRVV
jgi:hypothetical protein